MNQDYYEREISYTTPKGKVTEKVYFRDLTAGEQAILIKGQRVQSRGGIVDIDLGENLERSQRMVVMMTVDADGNRVYKDLKALAGEHGGKVKALIKECTLIVKDDDEDGEGNAE